MPAHLRLPILARHPPRRRRPTTPLRRCRPPLPSTFDCRKRRAAAAARRPMRVVAGTAMRTHRAPVPGSHDDAEERASTSKRTTTTAASAVITAPPASTATATCLAETQTATFRVLRSARRGPRVPAALSSGAPSRLRASSPRRGTSRDQKEREERRRGTTNGNLSDLN